MSSSLKKQIGFALLSVAAYTLVFNLPLALLLVIGVGWHEYCHILAAKRMNLRTGGFYLLPFIGGVALVKERYRSLGQQAFVVLAGPVGGGLLAGALAGLYFVTGVPFLAAAASWMAIMNLFNLLPFSFLDGGQLLGTITFSLNRTLGMVCLAVSTLAACIAMWFLSPVLFILILILGGVQAWKEYKNWRAWKDGDFHLCSEDYLAPPRALSKTQMALTIGGWATASGLLMYLIHKLSVIPAASLSTIFK
jgi:Zn-dependent protease